MGTAAPVVVVQSRMRVSPRCAVMSVAGVAGFQKGVALLRGGLAIYMVGWWGYKGGLRGGYECEAGGGSTFERVGFGPWICGLAVGCGFAT